MEKKTPRPMTPFDELTTPYSLSILKLMLPYVAPEGGSSIWILVKFMELKYTISISRHPEQILSSHSFGNLPDSPAKLLDEIAPYLPPEQAQMAETFHNIMNMMEMMQSFDSSSENTSETGGMGSMFSDMNPMDMMMGMLSPEQQEMFRMYQNMFSDTDNPENSEQEDSKTGDDNYERMDEQSAAERYGTPEAGSDPDGSLPDNR